MWKSNQFYGILFYFYDLTPAERGEENILCYI